MGWVTGLETPGRRRTFRWKKVENGLRERRYWVVGGKYGCAQLHAFTRFYTKFLGGNVTAADGGQRILPALPSEAGVCSPEHGRRRAGVIPEVGKGGQKVGKWTGFSHLETALTRLFPGDST